MANSEVHWEARQEIGQAPEPSLRRLERSGEDQPRFWIGT